LVELAITFSNACRSRASLLSKELPPRNQTVGLSLTTQLPPTNQRSSL
jgi:hypothetical protein